MKRSNLLRPLLLLLLLLGGGLLMPRSAHAAVTCTASVASDVNLGTFDPQTGTTPVQATLNWSCTNSTFLNNAAVTACFSIGAGSAGSGQTAPRQIAGGTGAPLKFQIYKNGSQSQVWGSVTSGSPVTATLAIAAPFFNTTSADGTPIQIYASVPGMQTAVSAGNYLSTFAGTDAMISYASAVSVFGQASPPPSCGNSNNGSFPFNVVGVVQRACTVTAGAASDIDFGNVSATATGTLSGTSNIQVNCITGTPYIVGLATTDGDNGTGHMSGIDPGNAADKVAYTLRQTSVSGPVWGNTGTAPGTGVGNDVAGNGNGLVRQIPVFAIVTDPNHIPGHYVDTVTVHITY